MRLERPQINGKPSSVWYVVWTEGRRSRRISTKTHDRVKAEHFLIQFQSLQDAPPEEFTIADLCDAYEKERKGEVAYPKAIANCLNHIRREVGLLPPSMWSRATNRAYLQRRRKDGVMDATIDKELRFLRQAFKYGVRDGWMEKEPRVEVPGPSAPRQRFMTREEFAAIYFHSSPLHLRVFLGLAIDTLARGKHILGLTWDRVDFGNKIIWYKPHSPRSKKKVQAAPMSDRLHGLLKVAKEAATCDHVVEWNGKRLNSIRKAYEAAVRKAGVEDAHKHDLRRSGASWAIQDGQSFDTVAGLLGDTVDMTKKTYAVFSPTHLRGVVNSIAGGG